MVLRGDLHTVRNTCPLLISRVYLLVVLFSCLFVSPWYSVVFIFEALFFKFEEKQISMIVRNR